MMNRLQYTDTFLTTMLPLLDEVIWSKYNQLPEQYSKVFRIMDSQRSAEQTTQMSGLGLFAQVNEGGVVTYDAPVQGFDKTYTHVDYAKGFKSSHQLIRDDKIGLIKKMATDLGKSAKETIEIIVAAHFNNGFVTAGPDGKALFATDHPIPKTGGAESNRLTADADLDADSLRLALTQFRKIKDSSGRRVRIQPKTLVIPSDLEFTAAEILKGQWRGDSANLTVNSLQHRDGYGSFSDFFVWDYLTDTDAWFLCADPSDTELRFYWRERPTTIHDVDFESRAAKTAMWFAFSSGFSDFYGVLGTPGA